MLILPTTLLSYMIDHAYEQHPIEACGILVASPGSNQARYLIRMDNADQSPRSYQFEMDQQLAAWNWMGSRGLVPVAVYHSHTAGPPRPSSTDIECAWLPIRQVLLSTRNPNRWSLAVWWVKGQTALPEPVVLSPDESDAGMDYRLSGSRSR